jgi:hypothetical protein
MEGLFSGLTPQQVMEQERQARSNLNLNLAQSRDPLSGTLFRGAETADALRMNVADIFGNPMPESAAVKAAKEQEGFRNEIARMMQEGVASGEPREETAKKIQSFLLSRGKVAEAEQMRAQGITESQMASKSTAEIGLKEAQTTAALAAAKASEAAATREKSINYGVDRDALAKSEFGIESYSQLTQAQAQIVNKRVEDTKLSNASANRAVTTFIQNPDPTKKIATIQDVFITPKPVQEAIKVGTSANKALALLNSRLPYASAAADQVLATLFGDSDTSKEELNRLAKSGALSDRLADKVSMYLSGTKTDFTNEDMKQVAKIVYKQQKDAFEGLTSLGKQLLTSSGITDLPTFEQVTGTTKQKPMSNTPTQGFVPPSSPESSNEVVEWSTLPSMMNKQQQ